MPDRLKIPIRIRRLVYLRSHGRCEYGACSNVSAKYRDDGEIITIGNFSHILPVGEMGPRWQFKKNFPDVDMDGADNLLLLCADHHRLVDKDDVEKHPPAMLFEMARRKSNHIANAIDDLFISSPYRFDHEEVLEDLRIGRIFELVNEAQLSGPKQGREFLRAAESILRDVRKNKFINIPDDLIELISLEITVHSCVNVYNPQNWSRALERVKTSMRKISDKRKLGPAIMLCGIFVRDEYGAFSIEERLSFIKTLLDRLDPIINDDDKLFSSFLLSIKAGLLRWRGRLFRSDAQQKSFSEAERCAILSLEKHRTPAGLMQLCLIKFTKARTLPLSDLDKYHKLIAAAKSIICSEELNDLAAATKYRPRFFREIYEFEMAIKHFWQGIDSGYSSEFKRTAFILGECSVSSYAYVLRDDGILNVAAEFLKDAIAEGYDHERNFMSWINCRSLLDPEWFRDAVHSKFKPAGQLMDFVRILHDDAKRYFGPDAFSQDALFGIDESEFWNLLARICRTALSDPDAALAYYERAEQYARSPGGNFTTKVGRIRAYLDKFDINAASRYLGMTRKTARAYQGQIIFNLEAELDKVRSAVSAGTT